MKFLIDAQLPPALCAWLGERNLDAVHVADVLGGETADASVAQFARAAGRVIVTKDEDFALLHAAVELQILWLRIGNASNRNLTAWLAPRWEEIAAALVAGEAIIEVR